MVGVSLLRYLYPLSGVPVFLIKMAFEYNWKNKEANFGPPISKQVNGGTHITIEIILKKGKKYITLRRPKGIPEHELPPELKTHSKGLLYFCHDLMIYGESIEDCVKRIVKDQAGISVKNIKVLYIDSTIQKKDNQWAFIPHIIAEIDNIPKTNSEITEVITFTKNSIPEEFAWWSKKELKEFLDEFD